MLWVVSSTTIILTIAYYIPKHASPLFRAFAIFTWLAFGASVVAFFAYRAYRIRAQIKLNQRVSRDAIETRPFVLYLRPFFTAGKLLVRNGLKERAARIVLGAYWDFELGLSFAIERLAPLVAIGHKVSALGAAKLLSSDSDWIALMQDLVNRATLIVAVPFNRPATMLEIRHLAQHRELLGKTLFFMPPRERWWRHALARCFGRSHRQQWESARASLLDTQVRLPPYEESGGWFALTPMGSVAWKLPLGDLDPDYLERLFRAARLAFENGRPSLDEGVLQGLREGAPDRAQSYSIEGVFDALVLMMTVFLLRAFVVEPFKVPSGSMRPTVAVGDFILVDKSAFGLRIPIAELKLLEGSGPRRGDLAVFRYPDDPSLDYIKRVVGLPGDRIEMRGKRLVVNGSEMPWRRIGDFVDPKRKYTTQRYVESLGKVEHEILIEEDAPSFVRTDRHYPFAGNCVFGTTILDCKVPAGHYFVLGDNRDNSSDSRVWGFVPDANLVGKPFLVWLNLREPGRFGIWLR